MNRNVPLVAKTGLRRTVPLASDTPLARRKGLPWGTGPYAGRLALVAGDAAPVVPLRRNQQRREDTIPPKVRKLVHARDQRWCQHCGGHFSEGGIHQHHRRLKQMGGDPRPHTDCACNLLSLCWTCHDWLHNTPEGRVKAGAEGFIIPNAVKEPGLHSVLLHGELDGGGVEAWLTCEGGPHGRVYEAPDGGEVA